VRSPRKIATLLAVALCLLILLLVASNQIGKWRQRRLVRNAQTALKANRRADAALFARRALNRDPRCAAACEIFVELADAENSPQALLWRQKLVQLEPANVGRLLSLASAASRFGEFQAATQALNAVPESSRHSAVFLQAASMLAIGVKDFGTAAAELQEAIGLEPTNEALQLTLATVQIAAGNAATAETGRKSLELLQASPPCRLPALRALLANAQRRSDTTAAQKLAASLHAEPTASLDDHLAYLEELLRGKQPNLVSELGKLQTSSAQDPEAVSQVMHWLNTHGCARRTVDWSRTLPAAIHARGSVPLCVAEAFTELGEWNSLRELAADANWHALNFLRLAIHMRAIDESSHHERSEYFHQKWREALVATEGNPAAITLLARLVESWGWIPEATEAWWQVVNRSATPRPALQQLFRLYSKTRDAEELYRVSRRVYQIDHDDLIAQNNLASLALLLDRDTAEAHQLAEKVYRAMPAEPAAASTYAYSLHLQGRSREAVEVLRALPAAALRDDPSLAACFGVVLTAAGDREAAKTYLDIATEHRAQLFQPEIALVSAAQGSAAN
jgi:lipopolysaccharide biosynthesis regulator YciM